MPRSLAFLVFLVALLLSLPSSAAPKPTPWGVEGLDPRVFELALQSRSCALSRVEVGRPELLAIIDYSQHSREKRLWVLDLEQQEVLWNTWAAHGSGSEGRSDDGHPELFSNARGSNATSLGMVLTGWINEDSSHDFALMLHGLEPGFNDNVAVRAVVMHPEWYVSEAVLRSSKRMGRSQGCPTLQTQAESDIARRIIDTLAGGSLVFSYYPDQAWLDGSPLLHCDASAEAEVANDSGSTAVAVSTPRPVERPAPRSHVTKAATPSSASPAPAAQVTPPTLAPVEAREPFRASWLHQRWLQERDPASRARLVTHVRELGLTTLYPNLAHGTSKPIPGANGAAGWVPAPQAGRSLVEELRAAVPAVRVVPYKGWTGCSWLEQEDWQARNHSVAAALVASVDALGADGVQVDLECSNVEKPVIRSRLGAFLAELKRGLGPERTLSVAIPIVEQQVDSWKATAWSAQPWVAHLASIPNPRSRSVARDPRVWDVVFEHADEVAVMLYDTWYTHRQADQYPQLVDSQIWAAAAFARRHDTRVVAGLRFQTWDSVDEPHGKAMHWHAVENPQTGLEGLGRALARPLGGKESVADRLAGVAWYRLDLPLTADRYDADLGERYLAVVQR